MDLFSDHVKRLAFMNNMMNGVNYQTMMQPNVPGQSGLRPGGGLMPGGGLPGGGGMPMGPRGSDFGAGFDPAIQMQMKTTSIDEEQAYIPEAEQAPVNKPKPTTGSSSSSSSAKAKKNSKNLVATIKGTVTPITGKHIPTNVPKPTTQAGMMGNQVQQGILQKAWSKAGNESKPFTRGNKHVVAIFPDGKVQTFGSIIKAHKGLGVTKYQLTQGKTPKHEFDSMFLPANDAMVTFVSKNNAGLFGSLATDDIE